jgi:hypothetical protein
MPTSTNRESLTTTLESRYKNQRAGGAYNAKQIPNALVDDFSNEFADGFTKGGQNTHLPKRDSIYLSGFSNKKYKG